MYRKVLVPLDRSKEAEQVLPIVQNMLTPDGEVILLHVVPRQPIRSMMVGEHQILGIDLEEADRSNAMSYLSQVVRQMSASPDQWHCYVEVSKVVPEVIVDLAAREEVNLIAMYTHHRKGLSKLIRGSIAEKVQRRALTEVKVCSAPQILDTWLSEV
jgi:nucleotide-binding universal stress UspA family protein